MKFTYFDECSLFGLADFERAMVRIAAAREEREVERSMFLRDPHLGDTLRAYEALGFAYPEARELLLCGIPRDLVATYADLVPAEHRALGLLIQCWRMREPYGVYSMTGRHGNKIATSKLVDAWLNMRDRAREATQMTPTRLGQIIMGIAMEVPGSITGHKDLQ